MKTISARIEQEVGSWEGVTTHPHRFGGISFRFGRRELGHLHGERWADLAFHRRVRDMLVETGRAQPHHVLPHTSWVSKQIRDEDDVREVVELFRLGYERALVGERIKSEKR
jgi:hypothetical protein